MQGLQVDDSLTDRSVDLNVESSEGSTVRQGGPSKTKKAARRMKWTKEDNILLWKCYLMSEPERRGYRKRFHDIWIQETNDTSISEQRICEVGYHFHMRSKRVHLVHIHPCADTQTFSFNLPISCFC